MREILTRTLKKALRAFVSLLVVMAVIASAGLVSVWKLDETSGTSAGDLLATNDGTVYGASHVAGIVDSALDFDGTDDYVDCGNDDSLNVNNQISISAWVKPEALEVATSILGKWQSGTGGYAIAMRDDQVLVVVKEWGNHFYSNYGALTAGEWTHITVTIDNTVSASSTVKIYINGQFQTQQTFAFDIPDTANVFCIGKYPYNNDLFNGVIDQIKVYSCVLGADDIYEMYSSENIISLWALNEAGGTTAKDAAGDNNGTIYGSGWIAGRVDSALDFDGTDDYVDCGSDDSLNVNNQISISAWVKPEALEVATSILGKWQSGTGGYAIAMRDDQVLVVVQEWGNHFYSDYDALTAGEWTHIAVTIDNTVSGLSTVKIYINGEFQAQDTFALDISDTSNAFCIGKYPYSSLFNGVIDQVKVYPKVLDEVEIYDQYYDTDILGYWDFNEESTSVVLDSSGNENHGAITGAVRVSGRADLNGTIGNALSFDGTDDYVDCGSDDCLNVNGQISISAWVKPAALETSTSILGKWQSGTGGYGIAMREDRVLVVVKEWGNHFYSNYGALAAGEWTHITVTIDNTVSASSTVKIYINGQFETQQTFAFDIPDTANVFCIGKYPYNNDLFNGDIDNVKVVKKILTAEEIQGNYFNLLAAYLDRSYYTTETTATAVCSIDMSANALSGTDLLAKCDGVTIGSDTSPNPETNISLSISSLDADEVHDVTIELRKDNGELIFEQPLKLIKRTAKANCEIKTDRVNHTFLKNGTAFFPIGIYMVSMSSSDTVNFDEVSQAGFNTVVHWKFYQSPSEAADYLDAAAAATSTGNPNGLMVIEAHQVYTSISLWNDYETTSQDFWDTYTGEDDSTPPLTQKERMTVAADSVKSKTNLLGYYTFDELGCSPHTGVYSAAQDLYDTINGLGDYLVDGPVDGYHPTLVHYSTHIPDGEQFTDLCDVLGLNDFWIPPRDPDYFQSSLDYVAKYTCIARRRAEASHKAFFVTQMAENWSGCQQRGVTTAEQRAQTYLQLVNGAKGILWFRYQVAHKDMWDTLQDLTSELRTLSPILLADEVAQSVSYLDQSTAVEFDPAEDKFVDVQVSLQKNPDVANGYILLAVNTREYSVDVTYTITGAGGTVTRLFSPTDTFSFSGGAFTESGIESFGTRAYSFTSTLSEPVAISVNTTANGSYTLAYTIHPRSGRENKTNIMQNPSLEDYTLTNWPHYCLPGYVIPPRINTANQNWGLTISNPYHGSRCLEITKDASMPYNALNFILAPAVGEYTFSVYLKASTPGLRVNLCTGYYNGSWHSANKTLTTSWARYSYTANVTSDIYFKNCFFIRLLDNGTIWVDAIQVEQASSASAFTTD